MFNKMTEYKKEKRIREIERDLAVLEYIGKSYEVEDLEFHEDKYPWSAAKERRLKDELFTLTHN